MKKQKNVVVQYSPICFEVSKRRFLKKTDMEIEGQRQRPQLICSYPRCLCRVTKKRSVMF